MGGGKDDGNIVPGADLRCGGEPIHVAFNLNIHEDQMDFMLGCKMERVGSVIRNPDNLTAQLLQPQLETSSNGLFVFYDQGFAAIHFQSQEANTNLYILS
jgi:hypothetical protein